MTRKEELRQQRAELIVKEIQTKLTNSTTDLLKIGKLLSEFKVKRFYTIFNFSSMAGWLENNVLGIAPSAAKSLMNIVERSAALSITHDELAQHSIAKLAAIFSLNPHKYADRIADLVENATNMNLADVKTSVRGCSTKSRVNQTVFSFSFRVSEEVFTAVNRIKDENNLTTFEALRHFFALRSK